MNLKNVNSPSPVLHIANLDPDITITDLSTLFGTVQTNLALPPPHAERFKSLNQMAYVHMPSVEDGVRALIQFHHYQLGRYPIRVSFSHRDSTPHMAGATQRQHAYQLQLAMQQV